MADRQARPDRGDTRPRPVFLDGLRGLVALYLVFFHVLADGQTAMSAEIGFSSAKADYIDTLGLHGSCFCGNRQCRGRFDVFHAFRNFHFVLLYCFV